MKSSLVSMTERMAADYPERAAVVGDGVITYSSLIASARTIASELHRRGVGTGDVVAVASARSSRLPGLILGIMRAGAIYLPLDPLYPDTALRSMVEAARPTAVVVDEQAGGRAQVGIDTALNIDQLTAGPHCETAPMTEIGDAAYTMFTSGSTAAPKGILIGHAGLAAYARALQQRLGFVADSRWFGVAPAGFSSSIRQMLVPLSLGGTVVVASPAQVRDPFRLLDVLSRHTPTVLDVTPSFWRAVLDAASMSSLGPAVTCLRGVLFASEELDSDLALRTRAVVEAAGRTGTQIWNLFGCTETSGIVSAYRVPEDIPDGPMSIGEALNHVRLSATPCDPGSSGGELRVAGEAVALGIYQSGRLTSLPTDVPPGSGRVVDTGDLVVARDMLWHWRGRRDRVGKVRGMRVCFDQVEAQCRTHPAVRRAAVIEASDLGVKIAVQPAVQPFDPRQVLSALADVLPAYQVPTSVCVLEAWPELPNGKTDLRVIADLANPHTPADNPQGVKS